jgi:hypothetical protein
LADTAVAPSSIAAKVTPAAVFRVFVIMNCPSGFAWSHSRGLMLPAVDQWLYPSLFRLKAQASEPYFT